jgi:membrane-associated protease RseP (regulator of RpoE activity)
VVLGIRKLKKGWRVRVLPKMGEIPELEDGDSETEYQIGLFPIGGFVKMLGQSDTGSLPRPIMIRVRLPIGRSRSAWRSLPPAWSSMPSARC